MRTHPARGAGPTPPGRWSEADARPPRCGTVHSGLAHLSGAIVCRPRPSALRRGEPDPDTLIQIACRLLEGPVSAGPWAGGGLRQAAPCRLVPLVPSFHPFEPPYRIGLVCRELWCWLTSPDSPVSREWVRPRNSCPNASSVHRRSPSRSARGTTSGISDIAHDFRPNLSPGSSPPSPNERTVTTTFCPYCISFTATSRTRRSRGVPDGLLAGE